MDPIPAEAAPPAISNHPAKHMPEFMKPYFRSLRTYKALTTDDEVDKKVINILSPLPKASHVLVSHQSPLSMLRI